jgi:type IV pilus assembly protein PilM
MTGSIFQSKRPAKGKSRVGLDIGNHSIKVVQFSGPPEKPSLVSFGIKKIHGSSRDAVIASIKSLSEELKISAKEVNISVSGPSIIVRLISMPKMTDDELASAVRFETEKFIPFDINDCILDFQILSKEVKEKGNVDILLAAAKKDHVWQKIKMAEEAGFAVSKVDVDIFAIANAFLKSFPSHDQSKTFALLNIGASSTELSILCGDRPVFVREVAMGGNELSAAVAKKTGLSMEQSEELMLSPKDRLSEVLGHAKAATSNLIDEVRLSFGYHENQSGRSVDEIYVSGGGSIMAGLEGAFHEAFGSKPRYWDPFQSIDKTSPVIDIEALDKTKHSFCVAVGLAMRG